MNTYKYYANYDLTFPAEIGSWEKIENSKLADAIFLNKDTPEEQILKFHSENPLAPIVCVGKNNNHREFKIDSDKKWNLEQIISSITPIIERKYQLPGDVRSAIGSDYNARDPLLAALAFIWTRDGRIEPKFSAHYKGGYAYPLKDLRYDTAQTLGRLREFNYIDSEQVDSAYGCPECHSVQVLLRDACPNCQSTNIAQEAAIHHFKCSYVGPESDFADRFGNYICPKCNKTLSQIGLDYDKPTEIAKCNNCGEDNFEAIVAGRCLTCDDRFNINQAEHRDIYNCILNERGTEALFQNNVYRYDPTKILSENVTVIERSIFKYLTNTFTDLQKRYNFNSTILKVGVDVGEGELTDYQRMEIFSTMGKELSALVRSSDAVSLAYNNMYVLLPGTSSENAKIVSNRLHKGISSILQPNLLEKVKIYIISLGDINSEKLN